jgi:predicted nucleic acid-binding protein
LIGGTARIQAHEDLPRAAGELAERHALRGYDALHLASALAAGPSTVIVSWYRELVSAALAAGLNAAPRVR